MLMRQSFWVMGKCSRQMYGIGRRMRRMSVAMLGIALPMKKLFPLTLHV